jgi:hypothetical protein
VKIVVIWLFANSASSLIFAVLSRAGLSASYTTVLKTLCLLTRSAQNTMITKAARRGFLLIYDNINQMCCAWDPDLGDHDTIDNGTAATYLELVDCDIKKAFDLHVLKKAQDERGQANLNSDVLLKCIKMQELNSVMALHCLGFLVHEMPVLGQHKDFIDLWFQTTHASH